MDFKWIDILDVIFRGIIALTVLFLITKILGKKQVSQLSLFDYVIGISIGNFAAEMTFNLDSHYANGIVAILLFGIMSYLVSVLSLKSMILRRFFMGVPTVVIQEGKIITKNLRKLKFDVNDLLEETRLAGYFDISNIEYAIMETSGEVSYLPKGEHLPITISDMNLKATKQGLCANVIIDGCIMIKNLKDINKNEQWLKKELKVKGKQLNNIILATVDNNEKLVIFEKDDLTVKNVLE